MSIYLDLTLSFLKHPDAEAFAEKSMELVKEAVDLFPDMPMIPDSPVSHSM
jgi:hypothetical protein